MRRDPVDGEVAHCHRPGAGQRGNDGIYRLAACRQRRRQVRRAVQPGLAENAGDPGAAEFQLTGKKTCPAIILEIQKPGDRAAVNTRPRIGERNAVRADPQRHSRIVCLGEPAGMQALDREFEFSGERRRHTLRKRRGRPVLAIAFERCRPRCKLRD